PGAPSFSCGEGKENRKTGGIRAPEKISCRDSGALAEDLYSGNPVPRFNRQPSMTTATSPSDGIVFASTRDGLALPAIDVTGPPLAVPDDPVGVAMLSDPFLEWIRRQQNTPRFLTRLLLRLAARRSPLVRTLFFSDQGYLDSITTYKLKLGADHLPE